MATPWGQRDEAGRISRRALLVGGGAAAATAGVAALGITTTVGWTAALHRVGLAHSPDRHVPHQGAQVRNGYFRSDAMRGTVFWAMSAPREPKGVIVCLHGRNGDHLTTFNGLHVHDFVAQARLPLAVVGVDGGDASYWHPRASGIDPQAMLHAELLPRITERLGPVPRSLLGWSMGGYGALLTAERHPDDYRVVVASSPALFTNPNGTPAGAFDSPDDFRRNDVFASTDALASLVTRIDCGTHDPFLRSAKALAARLPRPNPGGFTPGFHDDMYWRSVLPAQIATIGAALT